MSSSPHQICGSQYFCLVRWECVRCSDRAAGELSTVVQLVVDETVPIVPGGLSAERCADCGRLKYLPVNRGFFPKLTAEPVGSMVKTAEYFGSGGPRSGRFWSAPMSGRRSL